MGSSSNSSRPAISLESVNSDAPLLTDFFEEIDDALAQAKRLHVLTAVADEHGELQVSVDPKYLLRPQAPQVPVVPEASWDEIYEEIFQHMELQLAALRHPHVPSSVSQGNVATVSLVSVSAGGETVLESILEEHVAGPTK